MPQGYTRQSSAGIVNNNTILASHFNNEFDAVVAAFDKDSGHNHDGTVGGGALIDLTSSVVNVLPVANGGTGSNDPVQAAVNLQLNLSRVQDHGTLGAGTHDLRKNDADWHIVEPTADLTLNFVMAAGTDLMVRIIGGGDHTITITVNGVASRVRWEKGVVPPLAAGTKATTLAFASYDGSYVDGKAVWTEVDIA